MRSIAHPLSTKAVEPNKKPFNFLTGMFVATMLGICIGSAPIAHGQGSDGGKVDGALWTFVMVPKDKNMEQRSGMFRVYGNDIYQRTDLDKGGFDRIVGQKTVIKAPRNRKGKLIGPERTTIVFTDLQSNGRKYTGMTGRIEFSKNKFGEWSGRFVDGAGLHWTMRISRKQE